MREFLRKMKTELEDLGNTQLIHFAKNEKCSGENTKGVAETPFDMEINVGVNHKFSEPLQKKPGKDNIIPTETLPGLGREKRKTK